MTANADLPMFVKTPIFWKAIQNDKNCFAAICMVITQIIGKVIDVTWFKF